jgi:hypothetical protein
MDARATRMPATRRDWTRFMSVPRMAVMPSHRAGASTTNSGATARILRAGACPGQHPIAIGGTFLAALTRATATRPC